MASESFTGQPEEARKCILLAFWSFLISRTDLLLVSIERQDL